MDDNAISEMRRLIHDDLIDKSSDGWSGDAWAISVQDALNVAMRAVAPIIEAIQSENNDLKRQLARRDERDQRDRQRWRQDPLMKRLDSVRHNIAGMRPGDAEALAEHQSRTLTAEALISQYETDLFEISTRDKGYLETDAQWAVALSDLALDALSRKAR